MKTLLCLCAVLIFSATGIAQQQPKPETQLEIRNLQHQQDRTLIELLNIEARYKELQLQLREQTTAIERVISRSASENKIDLTKYIFDLDTLKFTIRKDDRDAK